MKLALVAIAVFLLSGCDQSKSEAQKKIIKREQIEAQSKARFEKWAYIAKEKQISTNESIRLLVIPSLDGEYLDTKCFIYTHSDFKQSNMVCPDAIKENIDEGIPEDHSASSTEYN